MMDDLILLHGALGHPGYFDWYVGQLSRFFNVHTPAFAGHAQTAFPSSPLTIGIYTEQLRAYCEANRLQKVHLFGYSMGGYVALAYAAQYPDQVKSVLTLATKLEWSPDIAAGEMAMLQPDVVAQKVPRFAAALADTHGPAQWKGLMTAVSGMLEHLGAHPELTDEVLQTIQTRVQLMVGDRDNMVTVAETYRAAGKIRNAGLAVLPDTVHPFEKMDRELLLLLMMRFFNKEKI